jgi:hypothetical protein
MKVKSLFLLIIALSFLSVDGYSQLLKKLKRAASQGASRAIEKTVEKEVEKATQRQLEKTFRSLYGDAIFDSDQDVNSDGESYDFSKVMGSINMNVDTESDYSFSGVAVMEILNTNENGKEEDPVNFNSFLSENPDYYGMEFVDPDAKDEKEKSIIIMDHKNKATVILIENEEEKSSMAFGMDWGGMMDSYADNPENNPLGNPTFEKTGNTKDILGYTCEEYVLNADDAEGIYWISTTPIEGLEGFWSKNSPFVTKKMKEDNSAFYSNFPDGNILEMNFTNKEDQSSSQMKIIEINNNQPSQFKMADYPNAMKAAQQ